MPILSTEFLVIKVPELVKVAPAMFAKLELVPFNLNVPLVSFKKSPLFVMGVSVVKFLDFEIPQKSYLLKNYFVVQYY